MSGRFRPEPSSAEHTKDWTASHAPAGANTLATATQPSAGVGKRNVCTGLTVVLTAGPVAPAAISVIARVIDGASGGGTYKWQARVALPAVAGAMNGIDRGPIWIEGSPDTPMTIEFSAAGGADVFESVSMEGTTG